MLLKVSLGILIASTPLYLVSATQEPAAPQDGVEQKATSGELEALRRAHAAEIDELRARLAEQRADIERQLGAARERAAELERQLEECMDMLQTTPRRRNCTPSRSLITHYQWMRKNGHEKRAQKALDRFVKERGDNAGSLNSTAWSLMNDEETAGKFDAMALALAERMQKRERKLAHNQLDTVALARFLNGQVEEAIRLQKLAIEKGGRNSDYRRRLRTYEAAKLTAAPASKPAPGKIAKVDDEE